MTMEPQCFRCTHYRHAPRNPGGRFCDAFPEGDGIPRAILFNVHSHKQPYPGDRGIRFESLSEAALAYQDRDPAP